MFGTKRRHAENIITEGKHAEHQREKAEQEQREGMQRWSNDVADKSDLPSNAAYPAFLSHLKPSGRRSVVASDCRQAGAICQTLLSHLKPSGRRSVDASYCRQAGASCRRHAGNRCRRQAGRQARGGGAEGREDARTKRSRDCRAEGTKEVRSHGSEQMAARASHESGKHGSGSKGMVAESSCKIHLRPPTGGKKMRKFKMLPIKGTQSQHVFPIFALQNG